MFSLKDYVFFLFAVWKPFFSVGRIEGHTDLISMTLTLGGKVLLSGSKHS